MRTDTFLARLAGAGWVVCYYLYKALLPFNLSFIYPRWKIDPTNWLSYIPDLLLLALLGVSWQFRRSWGRAALFALSYFIVTLGPVLGFFNFYFMKYSFVADHYQYVSIIGVIALVVAAGRTVLKRAGLGNPRITYAGSAVLLIVVGLLTWRQVPIYKDRETLWRETLRRNPNAPIAHNNLGFILQEQGKIDEAISHYRQAIRLDPNNDKAHSNLALALVSQGKLEEAVDQYRHQLRIKPNDVNAHINIGNALLSLGRLQEAESHLRRALQINHEDAEAHNNLAALLVSQGKLDEAIDHLRQALRLRPDDARTHANLGKVLATQGQLDMAIDEFRQALRIDPEFADAHESLARALVRMGKKDEAINHYKEALRLMKSSKGEERK